MEALITPQNYQSFLDGKQRIPEDAGFPPGPLNDQLFDWQAAIVDWAVRRGRAAVWCDCGLGKTPMQLEWARHVAGNEGTVLILAPLAVSRQTIREGEKFGIPVSLANHPSDVDGPGLYVTNYEKLISASWESFDFSVLRGVVLDESSILKSFTGKIRRYLVESFRNTSYRLACSATPAPNDHTEIGEHAEFLGIRTRGEMLGEYFLHDGGSTSQWRLKGHAESLFWRWLASWAVYVRQPSDLGFDDGDFVLPPLNLHSEIVESGTTVPGFLFPVEAKTLTERRAARKSTLDLRVARAAQLIADRGGRWVVWCDLNSESEALAKAIPGAVEVRGSDRPDQKEERLEAFSRGDADVIVTKPTIAGFGLNWQHCHQQVFVGLSDSWEQYYQATRRCWRFGQERPVDVFIVTSDLDGAVLSNIERKETKANEMATSMVAHMEETMRENIGRLRSSKKTSPRPHSIEGEGWEIWHGDSVEVIAAIADDSVDYTVFSPPFADLYTYSDMAADMGNVTSRAEFRRHLGYLVGEMLRVTKTGRLCSFHCMNLPTFKWKGEEIGLYDFRGDMIRLFRRYGWIYHSEVCIWKNPVTAMQRTKALGLLWKQIKKDSAMSRMGIPDYVVTMRKPGENAEPIRHSASEFPVSRWQEWASPVWSDINPSNTLQFRSAREERDEKHICPLQLDVIERCIALWSNPNDLVASWFAGIGSEGYQAIKMGRRFLGCELKRSYFDQAVANLEAAVTERDAQRLFPIKEVVSEL